MKFKYWLKNFCFYRLYLVIPTASSWQHLLRGVSSYFHNSFWWLFYFRLLLGKWLPAGQGNWPRRRKGLYPNLQVIPLLFFPKMERFWYSCPLSYPWIPGFRWQNDSYFSTKKTKIVIILVLYTIILIFMVVLMLLHCIIDRKM